ncbi:MAG: SOS response-associated peptidase [Deltaproteobacteria bacterium]|nr:SOS response-associated peptidase [Deltaproteobacteria bacterium]
MGTKLNNARGDTVAEKRAFRTAFRRWRCTEGIISLIHNASVEQIGNDNYQ